MFGLRLLASTSDETSKIHYIRRTPRAGFALLSEAERSRGNTLVLNFSFEDIDSVLSYIATAVAGVHFFGAKKQNQKNIPLS